jgi:hypothetical protein
VTVFAGLILKCRILRPFFCLIAAATALTAGGLSTQAQTTAPCPDNPNKSCVFFPAPQTKAKPSAPKRDTFGQPFLLKPTSPASKFREPADPSRDPFKRSNGKEAVDAATPSKRSSPATKSKPGTNYEAVRVAKRIRPVFGQPEIPKLRIGWHLNQTMEGYLQGLDENKPFVLVFHRDNCGFCDRLLARFRCPSINRYAGRAVFGISVNPLGTTNNDERGLAEAMDLRAFPSILVVLPHLDKIHIIGKSVGELSLKQLEDFIKASMAAVGPALKVIPYPNAEKIRAVQNKSLMSVQDMRDVHAILGIPMDEPKACKG